MKKTRVQKGLQNGSAVNGNAFYIVTSGAEKRRSRKRRDKFVYVDASTSDAEDGILAEESSHEVEGVSIAPCIFFPFFLAGSLSTLL